MQEIYNTDDRFSQNGKSFNKTLIPLFGGVALFALIILFVMSRKKHRASIQ